MLHTFSCCPQVHDSPTRALGGQGDGGAARNNHRGITDGDTSIEYRDLIYDPILNCYYDSKSNQYFALN